MPISRSSQSIHSHFYGLMAACLLHIPVVFLISGFHLMPAKVKAIPMETTGALEFSLASFVPAEPVKEVQKMVERVAPLPEFYEKREPKKEIKKEKPKEKIKKIIEKKEIPKKDLDNKVLDEKNLNQPAHHQVESSRMADATSQQSKPIKLGGGNYQDPFLAEVKRLIDEHNSYPRAARRMGLTGEVVVRMVLEENGMVRELKILESSTHAILDNQTINAIKKASQLFPKPHKAYILDIPIEYQLKRG